MLIMKRHPYMNPYLAGALLGFTLVLAYLILGAGLGASSCMGRLGAACSLLLAPTHTRASEYFGSWGEHPLLYYIVFMFAGICIGGLISALLANRIELKLERGASFSSGRRAIFALSGGFIVGFASRLANGCTSGQALSGGALLLSGSLVFMVSLFIGGFMISWFVRKQWNDDNAL